MNITVVSQYFWPESFIINDLVICLANLGHKVTVLTGKPNYPDGQIFSGYQRWGIVREDYSDGVKIIRVPLRPRYQANAYQLVMNYFSFIWNGLRYFPRLVINEKPNVILVFAPSPVLSCIPALYLKRRLNCPVVLWVQDLWPESLADSGFVKNRSLLWACRQLVKWIYRYCDHLLIPSEGFRAPVNKLADAEKVIYYPNSFPDIAKSVDSTELTKHLAAVFKNHFTVMFAGNFGQSQSLETIVDAAITLKATPEIKIIMVGSGHRSRWLETQVAKFQLDNIVLAGRFKMSEMPSLYAATDAVLLTLRDSEAFSRTIPSKLQAYMAAGKPILAAVNGVSAEIIKSNGSGLVVPAGDSSALAAAIHSLYKLPPEKRDHMGNCARRYFKENFEMNAQTEKLATLLKEVINDTK